MSVDLPCGKSSKLHERTHRPCPRGMRYCCENMSIAWSTERCDFRLLILDFRCPSCANTPWKPTCWEAYPTLGDGSYWTLPVSTHRKPRGGRSNPYPSALLTILSKEIVKSLRAQHERYSHKLIFVVLAPKKWFPVQQKPCKHAAHPATEQHVNRWAHDSIAS